MFRRNTLWISICCSRRRNLLPIRPLPPPPLQYRCLSLSRPTRTPLSLLSLLARKTLQLATPLIARFARRWYLSLDELKRSRIRQSMIKLRYPLIISSAALSSVYIFYHIEQNPTTGRWRYVTMTLAQVQYLSRFSFQSQKDKYADCMLDEYDRRTIGVRKLVRRLIKANSTVPGITDYRWKVYVIDDDTFENAFASPDGEIFVFTGLIRKLDYNFDQLGIIVSHEIAHTLLQHSVEKLSIVALFDWIMIALMSAIWFIIPGIGSAIITTWLSDYMLRLILDLPYSRRLEVEADAIGLELAARACIDVRESYAMWTQFALIDKLSGKLEFPNFLLTHPNHGDRAQRLEASMNNAIELRRQCHCPPLRRDFDPKIMANAKQLLIRQQLALIGRV